MATGTYKKLAKGATPSLGTSGDAVKALQTQLNTTNAGKAGYTALAVDGKYGPLTQAATQYKAPADTGAGAGTTDTTGKETPLDVNRFIRKPNANDSEITRIERTIRDMTVAPDLAKITAEKRAGANAVIDAITAQFQKTLNDQGIVNSGLNDRVRALNTTSGLQGSDFATANAVGQEKKNAGAIKLIEQERDAKINAILAGVDDRASEQYRQERESYVKALGDDLTRKKQARDEDRTRAKESIAGLAGAGISIDKLKTVDKKSFETLLKEYGGSQIDLETAWNASLPDNMKVQYGQITKKGANGNAVILRYGLNPVTGKTENKEYDLGIKYSDFAKKESEVKEIDGRLWNVTTDENGQTVAKPLTEVSELTRSMINENNASAAKSRADANGTSPSAGFKYSGSQRTKLINANFNDAKINAIEADLKKFGVSAVLEGLSTEEEKNAVKESLKGSDLAEQLAEYAKNN